MIKDENNARFIHFGHGTVRLSICKEGKSYAIVESDYSPITGKFKKAKYNGECAENLPVKSVCFIFDGENAEKSIDMLIEDLNKIKKQL